MMIRKLLDYRKMEQMMRKYRKKGVGLFSHVEIETINRCNGKCEFCPVNANEPQRPYSKMTKELFYNIIDQLAEINYDKNLALFSNNEPFLDKNILEYIRYARGKLTNAHLFIYTNGTILTLELFKESMKYLDEMVIDWYDENQILGNNIKEIEEYCKNNEDIKNKTKIAVGVPFNAVRTNRGGLAPNRKEEIIKVKRTKCNLFFEQLIIRPDGKVSLCCNDALGKYTLGDLNKNSILEIWYGKKFDALRKSMISSGRKDIQLCKGCDVVNTSHCDWKFRHWF